MFLTNTFAKPLETKSENRYGYGMLFDYHGHLLHGLNRYHLMVGIDMPDVRLAAYHTPELKDRDFCDKFKDTLYMETLYATCHNVWPAYVHSIDKVNYYKKHVEHIVMDQLPAIIPGYKLEPFEEPDFGLSNSKVRNKRHARRLKSILASQYGLRYDDNITKRNISHEMFSDSFMKSNTTLKQMNVTKFNETLEQLKSRNTTNATYVPKR